MSYPPNSDIHHPVLTLRRMLKKRSTYFFLQKLHEKLEGVAFPVDVDAVTVGSDSVRNKNIIPVKGFRIIFKTYKT